MEHEYTAEESQELRLQYRRLLVRQQVAGVVFFLSGLAFGSALNRETVVGLSSALVGPLAGLVLFVTFFYLIWNWRCPACSFLLLKGFFSTKCPRCKLSFTSFGGPTG